MLYRRTLLHHLHPVMWFSLYNKICSWRSTVSVSPWLNFKVKLWTAFRNNRGLQIHTLWVAKSAFKRCIKSWLALQFVRVCCWEVKRLGEYIYMHGNKLFHHRSSHRKVPPPSSAARPQCTGTHNFCPWICNVHCRIWAQRALFAVVFLGDPLDATCNWTHELISWSVAVNFGRTF